jgi:hypothetical protein
MDNKTIRLLVTEEYCHCKFDLLKDDLCRKYNKILKAKGKNYTLARCIDCIEFYNDCK